MRNDKLSLKACIAMVAAVLTALPATGCIDTPADGPTSEASAELSAGAEFYDFGFQCTVGGASMHCCPPGTAMLGAHVDKNVFKCASVPLVGSPFLDIGTQRSSMHACPFGSVMIGLQGDRNQLACQTTAEAITAEFVDCCTQDTNPNRAVASLHACPEGGWVMAGIHIDRNQFLCDH